MTFSKNTTSEQYSIVIFIALFHWGYKKANHFIRSAVLNKIILMFSAILNCVLIHFKISHYAYIIMSQIEKKTIYCNL